MTRRRILPLFRNRRRRKKMDIKPRAGATAETASAVQAAAPALPGDVLMKPVPPPSFRPNGYLDGDPAVHVVLSSEAEIHRALGAAGSCVMPGVNAAASGLAFRTWLAGHFPAPHFQGWFGVHGSTAYTGVWSEMTNAEYDAAANALGDPALCPWGVARQALVPPACTGRLTLFRPVARAGRSPSALEVRSNALS
jgi:hypothetical protein